MREYKSGTQYCFWRWKVIDPKYLTRLHVIQCPWFSICVHFMTGPDPAHDMHDHPVSFLSVILRGWYIELRQPNYSKPGLYTRKWFNFIRARDIHTITAVYNNPITLCFMGPRQREWGFYTENGFVHWKEYNKMQNR